jgi:2-C-methyl-D-erythritol 4-phosphate cytidylyltransferase/2-C-methyl-D-erythritol 2,4-cyclodiphosphate synthase
LIGWSLDALAEFGCDPIVVVVPSDHVDAARDLTRAIRGAVVTSGGDTRQASVARGLEHVSGSTYVIVHDAARPFVTRALMQRVLDAIGEHDGAIAAEPVEETLKSVDGDRVVQTVDRSRLWRAQTPQAFRTDALRGAHGRASDAAATDDAQLIELAGGRVAVVRGERRNIKITFEEDFALAEALIKGLP